MQFSAAAITHQQHHRQTSLVVGIASKGPEQQKHRSTDRESERREARRINKAQGERHGQGARLERIIKQTKSTATVAFDRISSGHQSTTTTTTLHGDPHTASPSERRYQEEQHQEQHRQQKQQATTHTQDDALLLLRHDGAAAERHRQGWAGTDRHQSAYVFVFRGPHSGRDWVLQRARL